MTEERLIKVCANPSFATKRFTHHLSECKLCEDRASRQNSASNSGHAIFTLLCCNRGECSEDLYGTTNHLVQCVSSDFSDSSTGMHLRSRTLVHDSFLKLNFTVDSATTRRWSQDEIMTDFASFCEPSWVNSTCLYQMEVHSS